ncbi:MAG: cystathionine gamma-synthase [Gemmatimonadota bacterium]|nr:MAG: cystathionine gamma-synthase [Gemmatimonadota bacterium]
MGFSTDAVHAGQQPDPSTGAVITPIYQTSTYVQESIGVHQGYEYARGDNPTRSAYEKNVAALEKATHGIAFGSGMAAIDATICTLSAGDHFLMTEDVYGGTHRLFSRIRTRHGLKFDRVKTHEVEAVRAAIRPETRMLFVETPTNPNLLISDLRALSALCREHKLVMVVDNTFATPYLQRPLEMGADVVLHSATKYLNGHSDMVGGIVLTSNEKLAEQIRFIQFAAGAIPGPFDCWLAMRGTKTLGLRMQCHDASARVLAERLDAHPATLRTIYPGLASHPHHELAKQQMRGFGGMISFDLGSREAARVMLEEVKIFALAESLGGVESLISQPAEMTHASISQADRDALGITPGLVRISVGIEDLEDLWKDLEDALAKVPAAVS